MRGGGGGIEITCIFPELPLVQTFIVDYIDKQFDDTQSMDSWFLIVQNLISPGTCVI